MDLDLIRSKSEKPLIFDKNTESTVSIEKLQEILNSSDRKFINVRPFFRKKVMRD